MSEFMVLAVDGDGDGDLAELAGWLDEEPALRGMVRRTPAVVPAGALGAGLAQVAVGVGSSGVATAAASVIVAWLRRRSGAVTVRISRPDGATVELRAEQVRALDQAQLRAQVDQLTAQLDTAQLDTAQLGGAGG